MLRCSNFGRPTGWLRYSASGPGIQPGTGRPIWRVSTVWQSCWIRSRRRSRPRRPGWRIAIGRSRPTLPSWSSRWRTVRHRQARCPKSANLTKSILNCERRIARIGAPDQPDEGTASFTRRDRRRKWQRFRVAGRIRQIRGPLRLGRSTRHGNEKVQGTEDRERPVSDVGQSVTLGWAEQHKGELI